MLNGMPARATVSLLTVANPGFVTVSHGPLPARRPVPHERVQRPRLVRALQDPSAPLIAVVAAAGSGKTALLCEWAERDHRPFAWVIADEGDNAQGRLGEKIARAIAPVQPEGGTGRVLVVDDVHRLRERAALDTLAAVVGDAGPELTVALASRSRIALPMARLREQRLVSEIGPRELATSRGEAATLLRLAGLELDRDGIEMLLSRTEGWPAGLSLAAIAPAIRRHRTASGARTGSSRTTCATRCSPTCLGSSSSSCSGRRCSTR
jgi:LuxR family transcriptional regulator, maltose regulon positive regulatory protein